MLNRPIIYYFVAMLFGGFIYILTYNYYFFSVIIVILFLTITLYTVDIKFFILILVFLLVGFFNTYAYYNFVQISNENIKVRIIENRGYYMYGMYNNKKIIIKNIYSNINIGDILITNGSFIKEANLSSRTVGVYKVNSIDKEIKDFKSNFYKIREKIYSNYYVRIGKEKSALILALAFGDKTYLSKTQTEEIQMLGIIHILTVSGLHIALLYNAICKVLGRKTTLILIFLYVIFIGAKSSTLRAFIMICILNLSKIVYRKYDKLSALSLSGIIILIVSPESISDIGFALSFLSVLGILLFYENLNRKLYKLTSFIREPLALTISAQSLTIFINIFVFKNISIIGYISNILLVPIYSIVLIISAITTILIPINPLFSLGCKIIQIFMLSIDGGIFILQNFNITTLNTVYLDGFSLCITYISYMLYKKNRLIKYIPLSLIIFYLNML